MAGKGIASSSISGRPSYGGKGKGARGLGGKEVSRHQPADRRVMVLHDAKAYIQWVVTLVLLFGVVASETRRSRHIWWLGPTVKD